MTTINIYNSLMRHADRYGWIAYTTREGKDEAGEGRDEWCCSYLSLTVIGCRGSVIELSGCISYSKYTDGTEQVHWRVTSRAAKYQHEIPIEKITEAIDAVKSIKTDLDDAAAAGAGCTITELQPCVMEGCNSVYTNTLDGISVWWVANDGSVNDFSNTIADPAEED